MTVGRVSPAQLRALRAAADGGLQVTHSYLTPGGITATGRWIAETTIEALRSRGWLVVPEGDYGQTVTARLTKRGTAVLDAVTSRRSRRAPRRCGGCGRIVSPRAVLCVRCGEGL